MLDPSYIFEAIEPSIGFKIEDQFLAKREMISYLSSQNVFIFYHIDEDKK